MTPASFEMQRQATQLRGTSRTLPLFFKTHLTKIRYFNATVALGAGVRLLTAQVHKNNGQWHLCHSECSLLDAGKLSTWLAAIKFWMDKNPNDVVTILLVNSDDAAASDLKGEFDSANISSYAYTPPSTSTAIQTWPTLNDLIKNNTRLVTFVASLDPASNTVAPYLLDEFTFVWENPYLVTDPTNFTCVPDRPTDVKGETQAAISSGRLSLMNHFLDTNEAFGIQAPDSGNASRTNGPSGKGVGNLGDAAENCTSVWGKPPNFILVDFFDQGPALATVDKINGITATGRTTLPAAKTSTSGAGGPAPNLFKGLTDLVSSVATGAKPSVGNWISVGGDWSTALGTI